MIFGEQFKKYRSDLGLSQPQLSELTGIEQSYLSKLENDKSVPSNEIFRNLLSAYNIDLNQFLSNFDLKRDREQLIQIPDIEFWFKQQDQNQSNSQRRYLYFCSFLIVISVTLFYIGFSKLVFNETRFEYSSEGVILAGEPIDIFNNWANLIDTSKEHWEQTKRSKRAEMHQRRDETHYLTYENKGKSFVLQDNDGRRYYYLRADVQVPSMINAWLQVIGVLLFSAGIMGFVLERRFFK